MGKVSGKTHAKEQLDHWANLHNPNNKAYKANKSHQAMHNSRRRHKTQIWPDWAPDYPEYDDQMIGESSMPKHFFDYDDGDFAMSISDNMAMDSDGGLMMRMGDHMAMDMDTGDIHMISSWPDDDDDD